MCPFPSPSCSSSPCLLVVVVLRRSAEPRLLCGVRRNGGLTARGFSTAVSTGFQWGRESRQARAIMPLHLARALLLKPSVQPQETLVELDQVKFGVVEFGLAEFDLAESGLGRVGLRFFWWGVLHWCVTRAQAVVPQPPLQGRTRPAELGPDKLGRSNSAGQLRTRSNSAG